MKDPGMAKVWQDLADDNRALLAGIRSGRARRSYSEDELKRLEAEAAGYERLASEFAADQNPDPR